METSKNIYLFDLDTITSHSYHRHNHHDQQIDVIDRSLLAGVATILNGLDKNAWKIIIPHNNNNVHYSLNGESSVNSKNFIFINSNNELINFIESHKESRITLFTYNHVDIISTLVNLGCKVIIVDKYDHLLPPDNCLYVNDYSTLTG